MKYVVSLIVREVDSGRNPNRRHINRLLDYAEQRRYDILVVWKRDRFGRSVEYNPAMVRFLRACGVRVESTMLGPQADNAATWLHNAMDDVISEFGSRNLAETCMNGKIEAARQGGYPQKPPPGWKRLYPSMMIVVDEDEAPRIRRQFEAAAAGLPVREIASMMGCRDHVSTMRRLRNPAYKGQASWRGIPTLLPAIVAEDLWERAQAGLTSRKRNKESGRRQPAGQDAPTPTEGTQPPLMKARIRTASPEKLNRGAGPLPSAPTPPVPVRLAIHGSRAHS